MTIIFFFNDTATTEIYTLSLHDALPISVQRIQPFLPPLGSPISIFSKPARSGQMTRSPPLSAEKGSNPVDRFLMCASGQLGPWDRTPQQTVLDGVLSTAALRHSSMAGSPSPTTHCKARIRTPRGTHEEAVHRIASLFGGE